MTVPHPHRLFTATIAAVAVSAAIIAAQSASTPASHGLDLAAMDRSVAPGDDFFGFANGGWIKATAIPQDRSRYGVFGIVTDVTNQRTVDLIQQAAADPNASGE